MMQRDTLKKFSSKQPIQSKKYLTFERMVAECVANSEARSHDPNEHAAWRKEYSQTLKTGQKPLTSLSNNADGACAANRIDNSKWQNTYQDDEEMRLREIEAQKEIDSKRKRIAPAYSKGNYQYITDLKDLTTLGKKI